MYIKKSLWLKCTKARGELCSRAAGSPPQICVSHLERQ